MINKLFSTAMTLFVVHAAAASVALGGGTAINVPGDQPTIQAAIDAATSGDEIVLADMVFTGPGNRALDFQGKAITLRSGSGDAAAAVIDCDKQTRGMIFNTGETTATRIEHVTIRNGLDSFFGGGADIVGASPTFVGVVFEFCMSDEGGAVSIRGGGAPVFEECQFNGNGATRGGAMFASTSAPVATDSVFDGNSADFGGALYNSAAGASGRFENCEFVANEAIFGGGVCNWTGSDPTFIGCEFSGNIGRPGSSGAGMYNRDSAVIVANCAFENNQGAAGAGMQSTSNASVQAINCMFLGNTSTGAGGGLSNTFGAVTQLDNCTFSENSAAIGGAVSTNSATVEIVNSILWGNTDQTMNGDTAQIEDSGSASVLSSCVEGGWPGEGNIDQDPLFTTPEMRLGDESPCIDAGSTDLLPSDVADLDGDGDTEEPLPLDMVLAARVSGEGVDMGPLEVIVSTCPSDLNGDGQVGAFDLGGLLSAWGSDDSSADLDGDGVVDAFDLATLLSSWGPCPE